MIGTSRTYSTAGRPTMTVLLSHFTLCAPKWYSGTGLSSDVIWLLAPYRRVEPESTARSPRINHIAPPCWKCVRAWLTVPRLMQVS